MITYVSSDFLYVTLKICKARKTSTLKRKIQQKTLNFHEKPKKYFTLMTVSQKKTIIRTKCSNHEIRIGIVESLDWEHHVSFGSKDIYSKTCYGNVKTQIILLYKKWFIVRFDKQELLMNSNVEQM
jgi:hypothetical protein